MTLTIGEAIEREKLGGAYGLNEPVQFCCTNTIAKSKILRKINDTNNYKGLFGLNNEDFATWQDHQVLPYFNHLKQKSGRVECRGCGDIIDSHREAYINSGQFYHRGKCSTDYHEKNSEGTLDYYERLYKQRLATGINTDTEFIEDNEIKENMLFVIFPGGQTHLYTTDQDDFRIWIYAGTYMECKENDEIGVFFRCIRYCLENGMSIFEIIEKFENHFGPSVLGVNGSPVDSYEIFIENSFTDNDYNSAYHSNNYDITNYDLCEGNNASIAKMIGILSLSQGMRKASIIDGLRKLKEGEFLELLDL